MPFKSRYYCVGCGGVTDELPSTDLSLNTSPPDVLADADIVMGAERSSYWCGRCGDELYSFSWGWNDHPEITTLTKVAFTIRS